MSIDERNFDRELPNEKMNLIIGAIHAFVSMVTRVILIFYRGNQELKIDRLTPLRAAVRTIVPSIER